VLPAITVIVNIDSNIKVTYNYVYYIATIYLLSIIIKIKFCKKKNIYKNCICFETMSG